MRRLLARLSPWTIRAFFAVIVLSILLGWNWWASLLAIAALFVLARVRPRPLVDPVPYETPAPLIGEWVGLNSPADKVPSHGTHGYGQAYAIDVVGPSGSDEPRVMKVGWVARAPEEFAAYGRPVLAVADGTVVRTSDRHRDHRSRESLLALVWMMTVEGTVRELGGPGFLLGNHVVLDHHDGTFSVYAHLRRGSLGVTRGDTVRAGQQLGEVGCTGNASEPHLHVHVADDADVRVARGLPFRWTNLTQVEGEVDLGTTWGNEPTTTITPGVPAAHQRFTATAPTTTDPTDQPPTGHTGRTSSEEQR